VLLLLFHADAKEFVVIAGPNAELELESGVLAATVLISGDKSGMKGRDNDTDMESLSLGV
jgi:hypothetical protein